jgi:succinate dehydrogenase cytochrome b556 subunit
MTEQTIGVGAPSAGSPADAVRTPSGAGAWQRASKPAIDAARGGVWSWLFQRITAVILIWGLGSHLIATHIYALGELSYGNIGHRLAAAYFVAVDISLLAAALYHALNGVRMVVLDYWFKSAASRRSLAIGLWVLGGAFFVYGMWALWPWITK